MRDAVTEFRAFLLRGNLVDMAVGIVIGLAFAAVVTAFVADLITPLIAAIFGKPDFSSLSFTINNSKFSYGAFLNALIAFVLIAIVLSGRVACCTRRPRRRAPRTGVRPRPPRGATARPA